MKGDKTIKTAKKLAYFNLLIQIYGGDNFYIHHSFGVQFCTTAPHQKWFDISL